MAVKATGGASTRPLSEQARDLVRLFTEVAIGLKRSQPETPPELRERAEQANLGPRHAAPMLALAFEEQLSVSELAQRIGLSLATTSQLVGELSRAGFVERAEDERDRRRTLVRLPEAYRPAIRALLKQQVAPMERTLARLSPEARAHFAEGFRILREEVGPPAAER
jgi:DNA-binding MarR family transcriptional regulator